MTDKHQVKLIVGFIFHEPDFLTRANLLLINKFGSVDFKSQVLPFEYTDYYKKEFGWPLKRAFVSFKKLIDPSELAGIKITTNRLEKKLAYNSLRRINIDPGYLDMAKLVLATTKDYKHRVYLDKGIYAEVTLRYENKTFQSWDWTYPDYKTREYIAIFNQIRQIYTSQIVRSQYVSNLPRGV